MKAWKFKLDLFHTAFCNKILLNQKLVEEEIGKHCIVLIMGEMCH